MEWTDVDGSYRVTYLEEVMENLGFMCEGAISLFGIDLETLFSKFVDSEYSEGIEQGLCHWLVGFSGVEIVQNLFNVRAESNINYLAYTTEYWIGYALALVQWYSKLTFKEILEKIPLERWYRLYPSYHQMNENRLLELADLELLGKKESLWDGRPR